MRKIGLLLKCNLRFERGCPLKLADRQCLLKSARDHVMFDKNGSFWFSAVINDFSFR